MQEVFEKIINGLNRRIETQHELIQNTENEMQKHGLQKALEAYQQTKIFIETIREDYNNGWIPVEERLPEEAFGCLVTVMDCESSTQTDFENILPYFVGYDGHGWNDADGEEIPFEVIAWQPLPEPYRKGE